MLAEALNVQALVDTRGAGTINRDGCLLIYLNAAREGSVLEHKGSNTHGSAVLTKPLAGSQKDVSLERW